MVEGFLRVRWSRSRSLGLLVQAEVWMVWPCVDFEDFRSSANTLLSLQSHSYYPIHRNYRLVPLVFWGSRKVTNRSPGLTMK